MSGIYLEIIRVNPKNLPKGKIVTIKNLCPFKIRKYYPFLIEISNQLKISIKSINKKYIKMQKNFSASGRGHDHNFKTADFFE